VITSGLKFAFAAAQALFLAACAAGLRAPGTRPAAARASERVGPWGITVALYEPGLFGPERPLAELVKLNRLHVEGGKLRGARLLANKAQRRLELWVGRRMVKAYRVQLGIVPRGAKLRLGDRRTPEGEYFICAHTRSKYYLALWISYPNLEDARRGLESKLINPREYEEVNAALKEGRCPPQRTRLGGDLLLHGQLPEFTSELAASHRKNPGRLRSGLLPGDADPETMGEFQDWTEGCIALFNPDIRELYEHLPDGTPLKIVADGPVTPPRPKP
jgi:hypothetical protein